MADFKTQLIEHAKAGYSGIVINTPEVLRAEALAMQAAKEIKYGFKRWTCTNGWKENPTEKGSPADPTESILQINGFPNKSLLVMHVFPELFRDPVNRQAFKDTLASAKTSFKTILLVGTFDIPADLDKELASIEFQLANRDEMLRLATALCTQNGIQPPQNGKMAKVVDAALGLTIQEAENAFALSLVRQRTLDASTILETKKDIVRRSGLLDYIESPENLDTVGGLDELKGWLTLRARGFSPKAREYGLEAPKGVLLVGVPGCGKSLVGKACQAAWGLPLLRLDMGRVFGGLVGQSEAQLRSALRTAEALAPCILFIDEFEKAVAGLGGGSTDGGTTQRVLGSFLTWMQDRPADKPVFIIATANDVTALPPEMLRKGRWDEIFAVDLPTPEERREIVRVHLKKRGRDLEGPQLDILAQATDGFTGSEIEETVKSGMWLAFADKERPLQVDDLIKAAEETVPLSKTMKERIDYLRAWAQGRARFASRKITVTSPDGARKVQI